MNRQCGQSVLGKYRVEIVTSFVILESFGGGQSRSGYHLLDILIR
jgi:hypothetical protein